MTQIEYYFPKFDQFKVKLFSYYTYPKLLLLRILGGPILFILGFIIYFYLPKTTYNHYISIFVMFYGTYYTLRPWIFLPIASFRSSPSDEKAVFEKETNSLTFYNKNITSTIKSDNIEVVRKYNWGYKIQIKIEKKKIFLIIPYKNIKSGNLDSFIREIKENSRSNYT